MVNSRQKGAAAEREAAKAINDTFPNANARRGCQFKGGNDSPDLDHEIPGVYFEVKRREQMPNLEDVLLQAQEESPTDLPVVLHRRNREEWKVTLFLSDLPFLFDRLMQFYKRTEQ